MKDIKELKDKHKGERCFILGTGPSLKSKYLEKLRDEITIGVNGIVYAQDEFNFHPTYIGLADFYIFIDESGWSRLSKTKSIPVISKFLIDKSQYKNITLFKEQKKFIRNSYIVNSLSTQRKLIYDKDSISLDMEIGTIPVGTTILDIAFPLAFYLGCNPIYVVGCDCKNNGHFYEYKSQAEIEVGIYGMPGDYVVSQYKFFYQRFNSDNRELYNLTQLIESCPGIPKKHFNDVI